MASSNLESEASELAFSNSCEYMSLAHQAVPYRADGLATDISECCSAGAHVVETVGGEVEKEVHGVRLRQLSRQTRNGRAVTSVGLTPHDQDTMIPKPIASDSLALEPARGARPTQSFMSWASTISTPLALLHLLQSESRRRTSPSTKTKDRKVAV